MTPSSPTASNDDGYDVDNDIDGRLQWQRPANKRRRRRTAAAFAIVVRRRPVRSGPVVAFRTVKLTVYKNLLQTVNCQVVVWLPVREGLCRIAARQFKGKHIHNTQPNVVLIVWMAVAIRIYFACALGCGFIAPSEHTESVTYHSMR